MIYSPLYLSPLSVALLYRHRWKIETFFHRARHRLEVKLFYGTSPDAVAVQVWTALIVSLLIQITERLAEFEGRLLVWTRRVVDALVSPSADLLGARFESNLAAFIPFNLAPPPPAPPGRAGTR